MAKKVKIVWKLFNSGKSEQHLKSPIKSGGFRYKIVSKEGAAKHFKSYDEYKSRNAK